MVEVELWARDALHMVFLIGTKLIERPSSRLPKIPPQLWLMILELVQVDELGRCKDVPPSFDTVRSLEIWQVKHRLEETRLVAQQASRRVLEVEADNARLRSELTAAREAVAGLVAKQTTHSAEIGKLWDAFGMISRHKGGATV
jgi:hypothetical protein